MDFIDITLNKFSSILLNILYKKSYKKKLYIYNKYIELLTAVN